MFSYSITRSQEFSITGNVQLSINILLGNQNQKLTSTLATFGTLGYNDIAIESGLSLSIGQLFKRHTIKEKGLFYAYDFFALTGIGENTNLLGSSSFDIHNTLFIEERGKGGFNGIGFGFQKEFFPGQLSYFNQRRAKIILRFSNNEHSLDFVFLNDLRFGRLFYGAGTDFGNTGSFRIGYSKIEEDNKLYRVTLGVALFTPKPDYIKTPNNIKNSHDGRKNVWYTKEPYNNTFYTNLSASGYYQDEFYSLFAKTGLNSQKLGAFIQNTLHDGFGLNPRFPWNTDANDKLFYEIGASGLKNINYEN